MLSRLVPIKRTDFPSVLKARTGFPDAYRRDQWPSTMFSWNDGLGHCKELTPGTVKCEGKEVFCIFQVK